MTRKQVNWIILTLVAVCLGAVSTRTDAATPAVSQTTRRAGLFVQFGDGSYVMRCISFSEESISGLDLLARSGLDIATWGSAVCRIEQSGCDYPAAPCFCQCQGAPCFYWSYWHWRDGRWVYSQVGAADYQVHDGDVEGWTWGDGKPPQVVPFEQICLSAETPAGTTTLRPASVATETREPASTPTAQTAPTGESAPLGQYAVFAVMAAVLIGGLFLRRRKE